MHVSSGRQKNCLRDRGLLGDRQGDRAGAFARKISRFWLEPQRRGDRRPRRRNGRDGRRPRRFGFGRRRRGHREGGPPRRRRQQCGFCADGADRRDLDRRGARATRNQFLRRVSRLPRRPADAARAKKRTYRQYQLARRRVRRAVQRPLQRLQIRRRRFYRGAALRDARFWRRRRADRARRHRYEPAEESAHRRRVVARESLRRALRQIPGGAGKGRTERDPAASGRQDRRRGAGDAYAKTALRGRQSRPAHRRAAQAVSCRFRCSRRSSARRWGFDKPIRRPRAPQGGGRRWRRRQNPAACRLRTRYRFPKTWGQRRPRRAGERPRSPPRPTASGW